MPDNEMGEKWWMEWRVEQTTALATLSTETRGLKEQVTRQNGNVAELWRHVNDGEDRMGRIEVAAAAAKAAWEEARDAADRIRAAEERASAPWKRWAERLIFAGIGIFFALVLLASQGLMRMKVTP